MSEERSSRGTLIFRGQTAWAQVGQRTCHLGYCSSIEKARELADEMCLDFQEGSEAMESLKPYDWSPGQRN